MLDIGWVDLDDLHSKSEVHEEAHSLFSLTKQFVRRSEELEVGVATRQDTRGSEEP